MASAGAGAGASVGAGVDACDDGAGAAAADGAGSADGCTTRVDLLAGGTDSDSFGLPRSPTSRST